MHIQKGDHNMLSYTFCHESGYTVSVDEGEIVFYKNEEPYPTTFFLRAEELLLCRADMLEVSIPLTNEIRKKLATPTLTLAFANEYLRVNKPMWN